MYKVAIFINQNQLRQQIATCLAQASCTVLTPKAGNDWLEFVCTEQPQFIIAAVSSLDLEELTNTFDTHEEMQEMHVMLVVDENTVDQIDPGWPVSDILFTPVTSAEVAARMRLVLWRSGQPAAEDVVHVGKLTLNLANYEVSINGESIDLTYKEYELLRFLISHPERVHTRNALLNHVWGYDYYGGTRTVDVHIRRLREKLGLDTSEHIETVRNVGYRFRR